MASATTGNLGDRARALLGYEVRAARIRAGLPRIDDLAEASGVSRKTIGKLEGGQPVAERSIVALEPYLGWAANARVARDRALREAARAEQAMTQLTVDRARLNIPESTFVASLAQLEAERDTALAEADRWAAEVETLAAPVAARAVRGLLADWDTLPAVYRRDMVARLIASIRVYRDDDGRPQVEVTPRW